jgi:hypothetical protein
LQAYCIFHLSESRQERGAPDLLFHSHRIREPDDTWTLSIQIPIDVIIFEELKIVKFFNRQGANLWRRDSVETTDIMGTYGCCSGFFWSNMNIIIKTAGRGQVWNSPTQRSGEPIHGFPQTAVRGVK